MDSDVRDFGPTGGPITSTRRTCITFHEPNAYDWRSIQKPIVHIKGFGSDALLEREIEFEENEHTKSQLIRILRDLVQCDPGTICFDGDNYSKKSFTNVVAEYIKQSIARGRIVNVLAFVKQTDKQRFVASWAPWIDMIRSQRLRIDVIEALDSLTWSALGEYGLQLTGAKDVYCLGGGTVVAHEFATCKEYTIWRFYPITRRNPSLISETGSDVERSALVTL
jgi:hypothetical protein